MYHKWKSYDVWFLRYEAWQTEFFITLNHFLSFCPPKNPKNQNFLKMKRPENIITLHMCTINDNHITYGFWDMKHDRQNFLSLWTIFCPFTPVETWKIKILKKMKKRLEIYIIILHKCTKNNDHMLHCSWDTMCDGCNSFFYFGLFFCPFTPLTTQKIKIKKKLKKAPGDIIILQMCTKNTDHMMHVSWNMVCNGRMDGWKKWHV